MNKERGERMQKVCEREIENIYGGGMTFNATYLNAIYKISSLIFEIGKEVGSSIRRVSSDKVCPLN